VSGQAKGLAWLAFMVLLLPASAHATVTIGSNLGRAPNAGQGCGVTRCTLVPTSLPADAAAPGGLVSPVNGTVVIWHVRTGASTTPDELRVVRLLADGSAAASATSPTVTPPLNATKAYPVQLPIAAGDTIGINCCGNPSDDIMVSTTPSALRAVWNPPLLDGGPPRMQDFPTGAFELTINADIEPTSAFTISHVKRGKGGKVTVTATYPNPGTLTAGDARDASVATAAAGKTKRHYLKRVSRSVQVPGQTINLLVKPTKQARAVLAAKGRLKARLKVVFTPTGGSPSARILKVTLKA